MYTTLITAAQLQELQQSGQATLVFDCSFDLARSEAGATVVKPWSTPAPRHALKVKWNRWTQWRAISRAH